MSNRIWYAKLSSPQIVRGWGAESGLAHFVPLKGEIMDTIANPMGTKKVFPLLISMAVPPMISMMIQSLYNIVDSMFAARLGVNAITAISLAYPLQNLIL